MLVPANMFAVVGAYAHRFEVIAFGHFDSTCSMIVVVCIPEDLEFADLPKCASTQQ